VIDQIERRNYPLLGFMFTFSTRRNIKRARLCG